MGVGVAEGDAVPRVPFIGRGRHWSGAATWRSWRRFGGEVWRSCAQPAAVEGVVAGVEIVAHTRRTRSG